MTGTRQDTMKRSNYPRGVDRLPSGRYRARVTVDGRQHSVGTFDTMKAADTARKRAELDIAAGTFVTAAQLRQDRYAAAAAEREAKRQSTFLVDDLAREWFEWLERVDRSPGTIYTYRKRYLKHIAPALGHMPAAAVTAHDIDQWYSELERGDAAPAPIYLTASGMFRYGTGHVKAYPRGVPPRIKVNPCQIHGISVKSKTRTTGTIATPAAVHELAQLMPEDNRLTIYLAAWCGLRVGEVLGLRRHDVRDDADGHTWIHVRRQIQARGAGIYETPPKSAAGTRRVPLPSALKPVLKEHLKLYAQPGPEGLLFPRVPGGDTWTSPNTFRHRYNRARDAFNAAEEEAGRLGLGAGFRFHDLRHTALTRAGQAGGTTEELKRMAGHSTDQMVAHYQHAEDRRLAALADALDQDVVTDVKTTKNRDKKAAKKAKKKSRKKEQQ